MRTDQTGIVRRSQETPERVGKVDIFLLLKRMDVTPILLIYSIISPIDRVKDLTP